MGFSGFFGPDISSGSSKVPVDLLRRSGCSLCPLDTADIYSPKIDAHGSDEPWVLCLGEAPGPEEDEEGAAFVGSAGRLLRKYIPRRWRDHVRYSNTIHCFPGRDNNGGFNKPTEVMTACCHNRVVDDLLWSKPVAVFGFGNYALQWVTGRNGILQWRGRRLPAQVGMHSFWFYPMVHPSHVLHAQSEKEWGDDEKLFAWDMARAFAELEQLPDPAVHTEADAKRDIECVTGNEPGALRKVREWLQYAGRSKQNGTDYETNRKRPYTEGAKVLSAAVSVGEKCLAFAFDHRQSGWSPVDRAELGAIWTEYLFSNSTKIAHFAMFELEWSGVVFGRETVLASNWKDTASQAWVLDQRVDKQRKNGPLSLGWRTTECFGIDIKKLSDVDRKDLDEEDIEDVLLYNGIDSRYHEWIYEEQNRRLEQRGLVHQFELMNERVPTVVLTQMKGIPVDIDENENLAALYEQELKEIDYSISQDPDVQDYDKTLREPFKPGAPEQVKNFYRSLNIFLDSADEDALKTVNHPTSPIFIRRRKVLKRKSTYVDPYGFPHIDEDSGKLVGHLYPDGLLHPNINTVFTRTGRSSEDEPNGQNVIKHDEEGKVVRKQVRARPGHVMVSVDQGQIQARNVAMESRDPVFCKMLWEDYDIHMDWAERLSRAYPDAVGGKQNFTDKKIMKDFRQKTKNKWTFALFFNAQLPTLASGMEIPEDVLKPEYRQFWRIFGGIGEWHEALYKQYDEFGYITNVEGFEFQAPISKNQIVNYPIQMDESLIVFGGMTRLARRNDPLLTAINEIHDDLMFEVPVNEVYHVVETAVDDMLRCDFDWINVPLSVEVSVGESWYDMTEEAKFRSDHWHGTPFREARYE